MVCCAFMTGTAGIRAQSAAVAAGGEATGTGGSVSFSIGEVDYITATGNTGRMTEGVQQPYEIFIITGIEESLVDLSLSVFPNPTRESVVLKVGPNDLDNMSFRLYDLLGNLLKDEKVMSTETVIDMNDLAMSTYFIKVMNSETEIKTFKIIKNI
jgi:hypothetical protein